MLGVFCLGVLGGSLSPCLRVPPFSKHLGEPVKLGGSRKQGCQEYLRALPGLRQALCQHLRHQFPSSSIGDEFSDILSAL